MAWLVSASSPDKRGTVIGSALGAAIVGVLLGPALGGLATLISPEVVFSGVGVLAVGLMFWAWTLPGAPREPSAGMRAAVRALGRPSVISAFWLFTLPAIFGGTIEVLAPLRLDELGASGAVIGVVFLLIAAVEAVLSPVSGRLSDRHGRLAPIRVGLAGAIVMAVLLPLPESVVGLAVVLGATVAALGAFWAPAMALLADAAENVGLDQALAFGLSNLAWAAGHMAGSAGGATLADATTDAVPYALLGVACALTLLAVVRSRARQQPAEA
jgi:predicted MFS family arabinose efflux permease